ncbi:MAG: hypothetical protein LC131_03495 [Anaerolineae bacterium]|nr:hypothetical protein [Anaerolineae bacterium]GIK44926.1 MAG: hypothetical protein BroJett012_08290 [Betaproteobacteria bacterium]
MLSNQIEQLATGLFQALSDGQLVWVNVFAEPFFNVNGQIIKVSPETGDREEVCSANEFDPAFLDDYWTGASLKKQWEGAHGHLNEGLFLVPSIPSVLGGEFSPDNLSVMSIETAAAYYANIREQIAGVPDGSFIEVEVIG